MTREECIAANRQVMELFVKAPTAVCLVEEVVLEDVAQNHLYQGRAAAEGLLRAFFVEGFPTARVEAQTILADEYTAVLQFLFYGRQDGPFLGLPITGREVVMPMVLICGLSAAQIQRATLYYDAGSLLRQLGMAI